jgi:hypothetical protein
VCGFLQYGLCSVFIPADMSSWLGWVPFDIHNFTKPSQNKSKWHKFVRTSDKAELTNQTLLLSSLSFDCEHASWALRARWTLSSSPGFTCTTAKQAWRPRNARNCLHHYDIPNLAREKSRIDSKGSDIAYLVLFAI